MSYAVELTKQAADEFNRLSMGSSKFRILLEKAALKFDTEEIKSVLKEIISEHKV